MKKTQCEQILQYLKDFRSITSLQAMQDLGCMRLASRINDLKNKGHRIKSEMKKAPNRYGVMTHFAEYRLENNG